MLRRAFLISAVFVTAFLLFLAWFWPGVLWGFVVVGPLILLGCYDMVQKKHTLLRLYPLIGHGRYWLEKIRPEIQQYFVETNTNGMPYAREYRSVIYQRAKEACDTMPFGTQRDVDQIGYEWMSHSLGAQRPREEESRITIGGADCKRPYSASHLNISAMSFGALSRHAILALNTGARLGGFAHNTGEGGLSRYHLQPGSNRQYTISPN